MRRQGTKARGLRAAFAAALAALGLAAFAASPARAATTPKAPPPATALGIWTGAEDGGSYSAVPGQHPNIANYYLAWGQQWPAQFISQAEAAGATPYIEIEPWHAGPGWDQTPSFTNIGVGADSADTDCTLDGTSYGTSCATWLAGIGQAVGQLAKPVIFTFAHEFNVSGQYLWSAGDTGSCGPAPCTPAQWIAAWDAVQAQVDGNGASQYAYWMWAPNADTGGSTVNFTPWWPGASHAGMVGLDGYLQGGPGWGLCDFQELFGQSFTEMKSLTNLPVFISETDLAPLSTSQDCNGGSYQTITGFMSDLFSSGGDGILQLQDDGTAALTSAQWSELDAALAGVPHPDPFPASSQALPDTPVLPEPASPERPGTSPGNRVSPASGQCRRERHQAALVTASHPAQCGARPAGVPSPGRPPAPGASATVARACAARATVPPSRYPAPGRPGHRVVPARGSRPLVKAARMTGGTGADGGRT